VPGLVEHLLLPERQRFALLQQQEPFEDLGDFQEAPVAHLLGVLLEAVLPVPATRTLAGGQKLQDLFEVAVPGDPPQADIPGVGERHQDGEAVRDEPQQVEPLLPGAKHASADVLDHGDAVVRVYDFLAHLEIHMRTRSLQAQVCDKGKNRKVRISRRGELVKTQIEDLEDLGGPPRRAR